MDIASRAAVGVFTNQHLVEHLIEDVTSEQPTGGNVQTRGGVWDLELTSGELPLLGPVIAGGVLASIVSSAAAVGGVRGALVDRGIRENEANTYVREFHSNHTIVIVLRKTCHDRAISVFRYNGAAVGGTEGFITTTATRNSLPDRISNRMQSAAAAQNMPGERMFELS